MRKTKKKISVLVLVIYTFALLFPNMAYAEQITEQEPIISFLDIFAEKNEVSAGDMLQVKGTIVGYQETVNYAEAYYALEASEETFMVYLGSDGEGYFTGEHPIEPETALGKYSLKKLVIETELATYEIFPNESTEAVYRSDFSKAAYTVKEALVIQPDITVSVSGNGAPGETLTVTMDVDSPDFIFTSTSAFFRTPGGDDIGIQLEHMGGNHFQGEYEFGAYHKSGVYSLYRVSLYGEMNPYFEESNLEIYDTTETDMRFRQELSSVSFNYMTDTEDLLPPELDDIFLSVNEISTGGIITVTVMGTDDLSGLRNATLWFENEEGYAYEMDIYEEEGVITGTYHISVVQNPGVYKLSYINLYDYAGRISSYYARELHPDNENTDLSSYYFEVTGTQPELKPQISVTNNMNSLKMGETMTSTLEFSNTPLDFDSVLLEFRNTSGDRNVIHHTLHRTEHGMFTGDFTVNEMDVEGTYVAEKLIFQQGEYSFVVFSDAMYPEDPHSVDLSGAVFTITQTLASFAPQINWISENPVFGAGEKMDIQFRVGNTEDPLEHVYVNFYQNENPDSNIQVYFEYDEMSELYRSNEQVNLLWKNGDYYPGSIRFIYNNQHFYLPSQNAPDGSSGNLDFGDFSFRLVGTYGDMSPSINANLLSNDLVSGDDLVLQATLSIEDLEAFHVNFVYKVDGTDDEIRIEANADESGTFVSIYDIHRYFRPGIYELQRIEISGESFYIQIYDPQADQVYGDFLQELSHLDFTVTGTTADDELPVFKGLTISNSHVSPDTFSTLELDVEDYLSGVYSAELHYVQVNAPDVNFTVVFENTLTHEFQAWHHLVSGEYELGTIRIQDVAGNSVSIYNQDLEMYNDEWYPERVFEDFSAYSISVSGTYGGFEPEVSVSHDEERYTVGDTVTMSMTLDDQGIGVDTAALSYIVEGNENNYYEITLKRVEGNLFEGTREVGLYDRNGEHVLQSIGLRKNGDLISDIWNSSLGEGWGMNSQNLDSGNFIVENTMYGQEPAFTLKSSRAIARLDQSIRLELQFEDNRMNPMQIIAKAFTGVEEESWFTELYFIYDEVTGNYNTDLYIDNSWKAGTFSIGEFQFIMDHTWQTVVNSSAVFESQFTVEGTLGGYAPEVTLAVDKNEFTSGEEILLTVNFKEDTVLFSGAQIVLWYEAEYGMNQSGIYDMTRLGSGNFTISIPVEEYTHEGQYRVEAVHLYGSKYSVSIQNENSNMEGNYRQNLDAADFRVTGTKKDSTQPELISVIIDRNDYIIGEKVELGLDILEEESGFSSGYIEYENENGERAGGDIKQVNGKFTSTIDFYSGTSEGTYRLTLIYLYDKAGNVSAYLGESREDYWGELRDFTSFSVNLSMGLLDSATIKSEKQEYHSGEALYFTGTLDYPITFGNSVSLKFRDPKGGEYYIHTGVRQDGTFAALSSVYVNMLEGTYTLEEIKVYAAGLEYIIRHGEGVETGITDLSGGNFSVSGTIDDFEGPVYTTTTIDTPVVVAEESLIMTVRATDSMSGISGGTAIFVHQESGSKMEVELRAFTDGIMRGQREIGIATREGNWVLQNLMLFDKAENVTNIFNQDFASIYIGEPMDFSSVGFEVEGTFHDEEGPEFFGAELTENTVTNIRPFEVIIRAKDYVSEIEEVLLVYSYEYGTMYYSGYEMEDGIYRIADTIYTDRDITLEAFEIILRDKSENETRIPASELTHLKLDVTALDIYDMSGYVEDFFSVHEEETAVDHEFGSTVIVQLSPGYRAGNISHAVAWYEYGEEKNLFSLPLEGRERSFTGTMQPENPYYRADTAYELAYLELFMNNGETVSIYSPSYTESKNVLSMDEASFRIRKEEILEVPAVTGFTMENKTVGTDEKITMSLLLDESRFGLGYYEVYFRIDGAVSDAGAVVSDLSRQEYYTSIYSKNGEYTVDRIVVHGEADSNTIYNEAYHYGKADSLNLSDERFTVSGTISDSEAPMIVSMESTKSVLFPGEITTYEIAAEDAGSGVDYGVLHIMDPKNAVHEIQLYYDPADNLLKGSFKAEATSLTGVYMAQSLKVFDKANNTRTLYNAEIATDYQEGAHYGLMENLIVEVMESFTDTEKPVFRGLVLDTENSLGAGSYTMELDAGDNDKLKSLDLVYTSGIKEIILKSEIYELNGKYYATVRFSDEYKEPWQLRRLALTDRAGNRATIYHGTGTPTAYVMNLSDGNHVPGTTSASLELQNISISQRDAAPGEEVSITAMLNNPTHYPERLTMRYRGEEGGALKVLDLTITEDSSYEGVISISPYEANDRYNLIGVEAKDSAGRNMLIRELETPEISIYGIWFEVMNTDLDEDAPVIENITMTKVEQSFMRRMMFSIRAFVAPAPEVLEVTTGDQIRFQVEAVETGSGMKDIELHYSVQDRKLFFTRALQKEVENSYTSDFSILSYYPSGAWRLDKVVLSDEAGNKTTLLKDPVSGFVPGYSKLNFNVTGTQSDLTAPTIGEITTDKDRVINGEVITYTLNTTDTGSGISSVEFNIRAAKHSITRSVKMTQKEEGIFEGSIRVTPDMPLDIWRVESVRVTDKMGNSSYRTNSQLGIGTLSSGQDWSSHDIHVVSPVGIIVEGMEEKEVYIGDKLDLSDVIVSLLYSDHMSRELTREEYAVTGLDTTTLGEQAVTFSYKTMSASHAVSVVEPEVREILAKLSKTTYVMGEGLELTGGTLEITYINDSVKIIPLTLEMISGFNSNEESLLTVTAAYGGKTSEIIVEIIGSTYISQELDEISETLDVEAAEELKEIINRLEDTDENASIIEAFAELYMSVMKNEKVKVQSDYFASEDISGKIDLPEVIREDISRVEIYLDVEVLQETKLEVVRGLLDAGRSLGTIYEIKLMKNLISVSNESVESRIENDQIREALTLRIPVAEENQNDEHLDVIHLDDEGNITVLASQRVMLEGILYLEFSTDHFSLYGYTVSDIEADSDEDETPGEDENPGETETPKENETPGEDENPGETETPEENETPGEDENPGETETPEENETPGEDENPGETETPEENETPGEDEIPGETETPEENETSGEDETTDETESPGENKAPAETEKSETVEKDISDLPKAGQTSPWGYLIMGISLVAGGLFFLSRNIRRQKQ